MKLSGLSCCLVLENSACQHEQDLSLLVVTGVFWYWPFEISALQQLCWETQGSTWRIWEEYMLGPYHFLSN